MSNCAEHLPPLGRFPMEAGEFSSLEAARDDFSARERVWRRAYNTCAECGSDKLKLTNHSRMWGDGDLHCANGHYVRMFNSG